MRHLSHIGVAEDVGIIVGLATYENDIGEAYFCVDDNYSHVKPLLIDYAFHNLSNKGEVRITIPDGDLDYQCAAVQKGFVPTTQKSGVSIIDIGNHMYTLPEGYRIISFDDDHYDADRYYNAIWRGFNNQRQRNETEMDFMRKRLDIGAPHMNLNLRILIVAPNGDYAAHCGMWHIPDSVYAYIEPVFTLPEYRRMGLGKAAVLEGVNRCGKLGAKHAYVCSSQQFYYSIGFYPIHNETWWVHMPAQCNEN
jgi:GNAT superfamily N-acetyltransferase